MIKLQKYAEEGTCPKCGSNDIDWGDSESGDGYQYFPATCSECETEFEVNYESIFTGVTVLLADENVELFPKKKPTIKYGN